MYTIAQWDEVKAQERQDSIHMAGRKHSFDIGSNKFVQAFYYIREYFYLAELWKNPKTDWYKLGPLEMICYHIAAGLCAFWYGTPNSTL